MGVTQGRTSAASIVMFGAKIQGSKVPAHGMLLVTAVGRARYQASFYEQVSARAAHTESSFNVQLCRVTEGSNTVGIVHMNRSEMKFFRNRKPDDPAVIADEKIRKYAEAKGGLTLAVWKLTMGRLWGEPLMMTKDEVGVRLNRTESDIQAIYDTTYDECGF